MQETRSHRFSVGIEMQNPITGKARTNGFYQITLFAAYSRQFHPDRKYRELPAEMTHITQRGARSEHPDD